MGKVLSSFNDYVHLDFCYVTELQYAPILHVVDVFTGFSAIYLYLSESKHMKDAIKALELIRINIHGSPSNISVDPEFFNKFTKKLAYFNIKFKPAPACPHNNIGVVERKNIAL